MELCKIDKKLLPVKAHYFLLNGAHSGVITFIPIYALQLGISSSAIGIILAVLSCVTVVSRATFGGIVDHFQKLKQVLVFLILIDVAADLGLNFIPRPYQAPVNLTGSDILCNQGNLYVVSYNDSDCNSYSASISSKCLISSCYLCQASRCTKNNVTNFEITDYNILTNLTNRAILSGFNECMQGNDSKCTSSCFDGSEYCESVAGRNPPLQIVLLSLFAGLIYISNGSIVSLSDAACYKALGSQMHNYGKQRLWGTVGWGTFAFLTGYLNQVFTGTSKVYSYSSGFYLLVILFALDLLVITKLHFKEATVSKSIFKDVGKLFVRPRILVFILGMYANGIATAVSRVYLYWYLRSTLGASQLILGCTSAIQCYLGELPFFFFSGWIIRKIGHINTFTMSFLAYGLKFLSHSFLTNPWWALPVELLQGPCFGSFYSAMTSYSKLISPEGTEATMQGIVTGVFEGLGIATGSLVGGFCISTFGARETFYWAGLISLAAGVLHWTVHLFKDCICPNPCLQDSCIAKYES